MPEFSKWLRSKVRVREERLNPRTKELTLSLKAFEKLKAKAKKDGLTGLLRREEFFDTARKEMSFLLREGFPISVAMLDIDDFKSVNDLYGHQAGDTILRGVAHILNDTVREGDTVGRYGGEEMVVFFPGADIDESRAAADRIRNNVEVLTEAVNKKQDRPRVTVSIGLTQYQQGDTLESMIDRADVAMYMAKKAGKNQVRTIVP